MKRTILLLVTGLLLAGVVGCRTRPTAGPVIYVSIPPLEEMVRKIVDSNVQVKVLLPPGTSPETYEPTPQQIKELSDAQGFVHLGKITFEQVMADKLAEAAPDTRQYDLSAADGISPDSTDPHVWLSPRLFRSMTLLFSRMIEGRTDEPTRYSERCGIYCRQIDSLEQYISLRLEGSKRRVFVVNHPALSYFANDFGLVQLSIEHDGKEPGAQGLAELIRTLKQNGVRTVLYERQDNPVAAQVLAREIGGRTLVYDPLPPEWLKTMYQLADTLHVLLNE